MSKTKLIRFISVLVFCLSYLNVNAQEVSGVLVSSDESLITEISIIEVRKIFLGLPASKNSKVHKPVINNSNEDVYLSFLKKIMRMTDKSYKRKLIKRIFRQGAEKIKVLDAHEDIVKYLNSNLNDITFMSEENAKASKGIRVIQRLW